MRSTVLGGDGVRSTFLAKSLTYNTHRIGLAEVVLLDDSANNLAIFGEVARYVFNTIYPDTQSSTTTDPVAALQGANYVIITLRVGGDESRVRNERIALQYNTLGQGATDAGGLAMAMRPIPVIFRCCRLIEEYAAEDAILFNFTNPPGLVTEMIVKSGFKRWAYGICGAPSELIREPPAILGCEKRDLSVERYGLNRLSRLTHFTVRGEEVTRRLIVSPRLYQKTAMQYLSPELVRLCGNQLLNEYLYHYYYREVALKTIQEVGETRGEQTACINQEMREALRIVGARAQPEAALTTWIRHHLRRESSYMQNESQQEKFHTCEPLTLRQFIEEPDAGGYTGVALGILEAMSSTTTKCIMVSIQNHGTLDFSRPDNMTRISYDLNRNGLKPVTPVKVSTVQKNMISCVKEYERLAVAAALQQDKSLAVRALMAHPPTDSYSLVKALVETYPDDKQFVT